MTTTTNYGTWTTTVNQYSTGPEQDIADFTSGGDSDWITRMQDSGAMDAIATAYRDAINSALPDAVTLTGDQFIGPAYAADADFAGYPADEDGDLDIKAVVEDIDLAAIVERHDVDNTPAVTAADITALLDGPSESPVLYLKGGPDDNEGGPLELDVWDASLVSHHTVVATREEARDFFLDEAPDAEAMEAFVAEVQETLDRILADRD